MCNFCNGFLTAHQLNRCLFQAVFLDVMVYRNAINLFEQLLQVRYGDVVLCGQLGKGDVAVSIRQQVIPQMANQCGLLDGELDDVGGTGNPA